MLCGSDAKSLSDRRAAQRYVRVHTRKCACVRLSAWCFACVGHLERRARHQQTASKTRSDAAAWRATGTAHVPARAIARRPGCATHGLPSATRAASRAGPRASAAGGAALALATLRDALSALLRRWARCHARNARARARGSGPGSAHRSRHATSWRCGRSAAIRCDGCTGASRTIQMFLSDHMDHTSLFFYSLYLYMDHTSLFFYSLYFSKKKGRVDAVSTFTRSMVGAGCV